MCDCVNTFNEQLRPYNVAVETQTVLTRFKGQDEIRTERVKLATYKVEPSRKFKHGVFPTFCPFCGDPYLPDPEPAPTISVEPSSQIGDGA